VSEFLTLTASQWIRNVDSDWDMEVSRCDMLRWLWHVEGEDNGISYLPITAVFNQDEDSVSPSLVL